MLERLHLLSAPLKPKVVLGEAVGHRRRARLSIRGRVGSPKLGIFEEGSHRVVAIPNCVVHHPVVNLVARTARLLAQKHKLSCYSDQAHQGVLRALQVSVGRQGDLAQVVLVANEPSPTESLALLAGLERELGETLHSLWWSSHTEVHNRILGNAQVRIRGPEYLVETMGNAQIFIGPGAFMQSNTVLFSKLVEQVHAWVPSGAKVMEYYSGVGAIGLGLLEKASSVSFNELSQSSLQGLEQGILAQPAERQSRARVYAGGAAEHAYAFLGCDTVIVDPPRKGLDPELTLALVQHPIPRLVYVSCGLDSFERDVRILRGAYKLSEIQIFDLFPFTEHIETLALFTP